MLNLVPTLETSQQVASKEDNTKLNRDQDMLPCKDGRTCYHTPLPLPCCCEECNGINCFSTECKRDGSDCHFYCLTS